MRKMRIIQLPEVALDCCVQVVLLRMLNVNKGKSGGTDVTGVTGGRQVVTGVMGGRRVNADLSVNTR